MMQRNAERGTTMKTTGTQVMVKAGLKLMTHESAVATAAMFSSIGGFTVELEEFGWDSGCWRVNLWSVNAKAGNRNLFRVDYVPTPEEAVLLAKQAKGQAKKRDTESLARIAAEREMNRE